MAYTTATPILEDDFRIRVEFTGPSVKAVQNETTEWSKRSGQTLKNWAIQKIAELNAAPTKQPVIVLRTPIDLTPDAVPAPTAEETHIANVRKLARVKGLYTTKGGLAAVTALQTLVDDNFTQGAFDKL